MTRNERGAVAMELVLLTPALILVLGLVIAAGRIWLARGALTEASYSAVRAATLARNATQAKSDAQAAFDRAVTGSELPCSDKAMVVDLSAFALSPGLPATVRVRATCQVPLADLTLPGLPGRLTLHAQADSALDTYRSRR